MLRTKALMTLMSVAVAGLYLIPPGACDLPPWPDLWTNVCDANNNVVAQVGIYVPDVDSPALDLQSGTQYQYALWVWVPAGDQIGTAAMCAVFHRFQAMGSVPGDGSAPSNLPGVPNRYNAAFQGFSCSWSSGCEAGPPPPCWTALHYWETDPSWPDGIDNSASQYDLWLVSQGNFTPTPGTKQGGGSCDCDINYFLVGLGMHTTGPQASGCVQPGVPTTEVFVQK